MCSATFGIFAGASVSGDLKELSEMIPKGTLCTMLTTVVVYFVIILFMALSHHTLLFYCELRRGFFDIPVGYTELVTG